MPGWRLIFVGSSEFFWPKPVESGLLTNSMAKLILTAVVESLTRVLNKEIQRPAE